MNEEKTTNKIEKELLEMLKNNPEIMKFFSEHPDYLKEIIKSYEEKKTMVSLGEFDKNEVFEKDKDIIARMAQEA